MIENFPLLCLLLLICCLQVASRKLITGNTGNNENTFILFLKIASQTDLSWNIPDLSHDIQSGNIILYERLYRQRVNFSINFPETHSNRLRLCDHDTFTGFTQSLYESVNARSRRWIWKLTLRITNDDERFTVFIQKKLMKFHFIFIWYRHLFFNVPSKLKNAFFVRTIFLCIVLYWYSSVSSS